MNPPFDPRPVPAMPVPAPDAMVRLDAASCIDQDIDCRRCGYNLRGLSTDGRCPECGNAVGRSIRGDFLRFCDPEWVEKLASGMNWIVASIVIGIIGGILAAFVGGGFAVAMTAGGGSINPIGFVIGGVLMQLAVGAVGLIGYWKVTTPDPGRPEAETGVNARQLVRGAQTIAYVAAPLQFALEQLAAIAGMVVATIQGIVGLVGTVAVFVYGRQLALRIPDDRLARHCRIVMWGLAITLLATVLLGVSALLSFSTSGPVTTPVFPPTTSVSPLASGTGGSGGTNMQPVNPPAGLPANPGSGFSSAGTGTATGPGPLVMGAGIGAGCAVGLSYLVFAIWSYRLLFRFRKAFLAAAQQARATWAAVSVGGPVSG